MLKKFKYSFLVLTMSVCSIMILIPKVSAASSATMSWSGVSTVSAGATFTMDIVSSASTGGGALMSAGGEISSSDTSCISFVSVTKVASGTTNGSKFAYSDMDGNDQAFTIARATFKAGSTACSTNINILNPKLAFTDSTRLSPATISKKITVGSSTDVQSNDATLKSLTPDKGSLSPTFASGISNYSLVVDDSVSIVNFSAVVNNSNASITSGTSCSVASNSTACKIVVKAEDGTTKTYTINVTKKTTSNSNSNSDSNKSSDANLKSLSVSGYTLSPVFNKNTTTYRMTVNSNINSLVVTALPNNPNATVKITGNSGWKEGVNAVKIVVTAEDGTTKTYTVNVTKKGENSNIEEETLSSDNYLSDIVVADGILAPVFKKDVTEYSITVPNDITKLNLDAIPSSDKSKVKINGNSNFEVGKVNVVTIDVTAEDGSLRTYTINVTRSDKKSDNLLEDLIIEDIPLTPKFSPKTYEYVVDVPDGKNSLDIKAIAANNNAKVEIEGNENLVNGKNKISVIVTDENGFSKIYTIYAYKNGENRFLGLRLKQWLIILGIILLLLFLLLLLLLTRKKKKEPVANDEKEEKSHTIIEFKPEFNFGSKNGTDNDVVEEGGTLNQYTASALPEKEKPELLETTKVLGNSSKIQDAEYVPYDLYDDIVTKDELMDAIKEAKETNDSSVLDMLLAQEALNRQKEEVKNKRKD